MTALSDGLFFVCLCVVILMLVYKMFTFFEFTRYTFTMNLLREGSIFVCALIFGLTGRSLALLNANDLIYITGLNILEMIGTLLIVIQVVTLLMSLKGTTVRNEARVGTGQE